MTMLDSKAPDWVQTIAWTAEIDGHLVEIIERRIRDVYGPRWQVYVDDAMTNEELFRTLDEAKAAAINDVGFLGGS